jgi:hypothetical protein
LERASEAYPPFYPSFLARTAEKDDQDDIVISEKGVI